MKAFRFHRFTLWLRILFLWVLSHSLVASAQEIIDIQPVTDIGVDAVFDFDQDGEADTTYEHISAESPQDGPLYYDVNFFLRSTFHLRFLRATTQRINLLQGETVSGINPVYINPGEGNSVTLLVHGARQVFSQWRYYNPVANNPHAFFLDKTEVLAGFRLTSLELGTVHHGWLRFTRPDSHFTTPFAVAGYDWNPLPGEPIAAGEPPPIPLTPVVTPEGLQLTWPPEVWDWVLESSESLDPDAMWEPVPEAYGPEVTVLFPETTRFFRMRRP